MEIKTFYEQEDDLTLVYNPIDILDQLSILFGEITTSLDCPVSS